MSKAILTEAREIFLMMSMLVGLSGLSLAVACGAVMIADSQTQHIAGLAMNAPISSFER